MDSQHRILERLRPLGPASFAEHELRAVAANGSVAVDPEWWKSVGWMNRLTRYLGMFPATEEFELRVSTPPGRSGRPARTAV